MKKALKIRMLGTMQRKTGPIAVSVPVWAEWLTRYVERFILANGRGPEMRYFVAVRS